MTPAAWAFIFQIAAPLGNDLITRLLNLYHQDRSGTPVTSEQWLALGREVSSKTADQFLENSLNKLASNAPAAPPSA